MKNNGRYSRLIGLQSARVTCGSRPRVQKGRSIRRPRQSTGSRDAREVSRTSDVPPHPPGRVFFVCDNRGFHHPAKFRQTSGLSLKDLECGDMSSRTPSLPVGAFDFRFCFFVEHSNETCSMFRYDGIDLPFRCIIFHSFAVYFAKAAA